jgi:superfamily II DNA/RNA helicase
MQFTPYHAKYFSHELTKRLPSSDLGKLAQSLQDAQVDLNPHQVEAALFAFKSPLSRGAILADEVGLGKTIEAGLILSQKWAERKRKLLVIAPANLRKQWNQELMDKFYLKSTILESKSFNEITKAGNLNPFDQKDSIVICSYQFARAKDAYLKFVDWDLVIIDEAHRLRNVYKPSNKIGRAIKEALVNAPKVLLTATPLQNSILELYGLVSIIDDYTFGDLPSFKAQFSKNLDEANYQDLRKRIQPICKRTLRKNVVEINFTNRIALVEEFYPYADEQELYELVTEYLTRKNLYALPASQRQLMTLILRKLLASSSYAISGTFAGLATKLENMAAVKEPLTAVDDVVGDNFETVDEYKEEFDDNEKEDKPEIIYTAEQLQGINNEIKDLRRFQELATNIVKNSKGEKLFTALEKGFAKLDELGAPQKAIIFTESTRTQNYLREVLETKGFKDKIVLFNGSNNDPISRKIYNEWIKRHEGTDKISGSRSADMRAALVDAFRNEATIMIATEAAAEGINLQFCSLVVNYDLPWNPQRIEQRIGRCHRYGQKFDVVVINFLNKANEADQRVYELLDQKFKLFSGVFGVSDEVLGSIESGIDFEKRIAKIYQNYRSTEEIRKAFEDLKKELEPEIEERIDITKRKLFENLDHDVICKVRLNPEEGREYLRRYEEWLWNITKYYLKDFAEFDAADDAFVLKKNPFSNEDIHPGPYKILKTKKDQKKSEIEVQDDTNIFRVGHPLAQRIIKACKDEKLAPKELTFDLNSSQGKITVLEQYKGKGGWLKVNCITINSFEAEDHLILVAITDDGEELDQELCEKFFDLSAKETMSGVVKKDSAVEERFLRKVQELKTDVLDDNMKRNAQFFDEEYDKLDKWAGDMRESLEMELKELDREIKMKKAEVKKIMNLEQKIKEQRIIKDLEKKRNDKRITLFQAQDDIDKKKDTLLTQIEDRLKQKIEETELFTIRWILK